MLCCVPLPRQDHIEPFPILLPRESTPGHPWAPLGDNHGTVPSLAGGQEASLRVEKMLDCVNPGVLLLRVIKTNIGKSTSGSHGTCTHHSPMAAQTLPHPNVGPLTSPSIYCPLPVLVQLIEAFLHSQLPFALCLSWLLSHILDIAFT